MEAIRPMRKSIPPGDASHFQAAKKANDDWVLVGPTYKRLFACQEEAEIRTKRTGIEHIAVEVVITKEDQAEAAAGVRAANA